MLVYLSIIIPTYNMENYMGKCLDSLIYSNNLSDIEILVINDGSTDNSLVIAEKYAQRFPGTFRVIDKSNGNYGSCINRGLQEAKGEYIKVLDADDTFDRNGLSGLLNVLKSDEYDIVLSDYDIVDASGNVNEKVNFKNEFPCNRAFRMDEEIKNNKHFWGAMHALCYRTQILRDIGYRQLEGFSYTDMQWGLMPITQCKNAYYYPHVVYKYLLGREGQTMSKEQLDKSKSQIMKVLLAMANDTEKITWDKDKFGAFVYNKFIGHLQSLYRDLLDKNNTVDLIEFDKNLSKYEYVYSLADNLIYQGRFHYVTYWRKHNYQKISNILLSYYRIIEQIYVFVFSIINKIRK